LNELNPQAQAKLESSQNIWLASVRPDGSPHLAPVWFAWYAGKLYVSIEASSVKGRNLARNPAIALALEDGSSPVICEGRARPVQPPWPAEVLAVFQRKYDWDLASEKRYSQLLEVTPRKWLAW
jgi:nitroimidazol reductase NimA-like FMN-containing flavoprotein (pyridoxamine 5'-phosphate oxidase superfamily)